MTKRIWVVVLACCMACMSGCSTNSTLSTGTDLQTVTYQVFGMDCPGCHGGLEKNIRKISGVAFARANWKGQTVTIGMKAGENVAETDIAEAIRRSNFTMGKKVD
jgi:copper chaperone CopZ